MRNGRVSRQYSWNASRFSIPGRHHNNLNANATMSIKPLFSSNYVSQTPHKASDRIIINMRKSTINTLMALSAATRATAQTNMTMSGNSTAPGNYTPIASPPYPAGNSTNMTSPAGTTGGTVTGPSNTQMSKEPCPEESSTTPSTGSASIIRLEYGAVTLMAWVGYMLGGAL